MDLGLHQTEKNWKLGAGKRCIGLERSNSCTAQVKKEERVISDRLGRKRAPIPVVPVGPVFGSKPHQVFPDRLRRDGLDGRVSSEIDPLLKAKLVVSQRAGAEALGGLGIEEADQGLGQ